MGIPGGCSWTMNWLTFDNSYYTIRRGKRSQNVHVVRDSGVDTVVSTPASTRPIQTPFRESNSDGNGGNPYTSATVAPSTSGSMSQNQLLWLPTDRVLAETPEFSCYFNCFKESQETWFEEYAKAHLKMSLLGAKMHPKGGFKLTE